MRKMILICVLLTVAAVFFMPAADLSAQEEGDVVDDVKEILQNQELILEKLDALDKKLDVLKMRIKI